MFKSRSNIRANFFSEDQRISEIQVQKHVNGSKWNPTCVLRTADNLIIPSKGSAIVSKMFRAIPNNPPDNPITEVDNKY